MKTSRSKGEPPTEDRNIPVGTYVMEGMKGSARGSRFELESDHGGFHGVVSHGIRFANVKVAESSAKSEALNLPRAPSLTISPVWPGRGSL